MGGRGSSSGKGKSGGSANTPNIQAMSQGEESYVKLPPTWLNKDGQTVVAKTADGEYVYKVGFDKTDYRIDTDSSEYKKALQGYNIKASFKADGSVSVAKGGLFSKKRTFKTIDAFEKEANKKLDAYKAYYDRDTRLTKSGRITQLQAENLKSLIYNDTPNALKRFNDSLKTSLMSSRTRSVAAQDMKERLSVAVRNARKKIAK